MKAVVKKFEKEGSSLVNRANTAKINPAQV